jgi:hypothetical protein
MAKIGALARSEARLDAAGIVAFWEDRGTLRLSPYVPRPSTFLPGHVIGFAMEIGATTRPSRPVRFSWASSSLAATAWIFVSKCCQEFIVIWCQKIEHQESCSITFPRHACDIAFLTVPSRASHSQFLTHQGPKCRPTWRNR